MNIPSGDAPPRTTPEPSEAALATYPAALLLDEAGRIHSFNPSAELLFDYFESQAVGRSVRDLLPSLAFPLFSSAAPDFASDSRLVQGRRRDGTTLPLELTLSQVAFAGRRFCVATLRRPAFMLPATLSHDKYRLLFEFNPQPMWVYEVQTLQFLAVNQTAIAKYGYSRDEFLAMTIADIRPPEDVSRLRANIPTGPHPAGDGTEWRHRRRDGTLLTVEITSHAIMYEGRAARLVVATDVTVRKHIEQALRQAHEELELRVQERTADLEVINDYLHFEIHEREQAEDALRRAEDDLRRSNVELTLAYDATIEGWSRALDLRDHETEGHTQRVTEMTLRLARRLGVAPSELAQVRRGALLHDIGKMGIPDSILLKPGPLRDDEWIVMRRHPVYAHALLSPIPFLHPALVIPFCHHEKWDGSGYPRGLCGESIPLAARLFCLADVWDALRSDRPYRRGWPADQVRAHLRALSGSHFDPSLVEPFLEMDLDEF